MERYVIIFIRYFQSVRNYKTHVNTTADHMVETGPADGPQYSGTDYIDTIWIERRRREQLVCNVFRTTFADHRHWVVLVAPGRNALATNHHRPEPSQVPPDAFL